VVGSKDIYANIKSLGDINVRRAFGALPERKPGSGKNLKGTHRRFLHDDEVNAVPVIGPDKLRAR
jgi:hypothetical protein